MRPSDNLNGTWYSWSFVYRSLPLTHRCKEVKHMDGWMESAYFCIQEVQNRIHHCRCTQVCPSRRGCIRHHRCIVWPVHMLGSLPTPTSVCHGPLQQVYHMLQLRNQTDRQMGVFTHSWKKMITKKGRNGGRQTALQRRNKQNWRCINSLCKRRETEEHTKH